MVAARLIRPGPPLGDPERIAQLYAPMQLIVSDLITRAQETIDEAHPDHWIVKVVDAYRSSLRQMEIFRRGRIQRPDGSWAPIAGQAIETLALPNESPHCVRLTGGAPAAMAVHIAIAARDSGLFAPPNDLIWSVIASSAWQAGRGRIAPGACLRCGAKSFCVEWVGWSQIVHAGVVLPTATATEEAAP